MKFRNWATYVVFAIAVFTASTAFAQSAIPAGADVWSLILPVFLFIAIVIGLFVIIGKKLSAGKALSSGTNYSPQYGTANFVAALVSFGGWILLVFGIVGAIGGVLIAYQIGIDSRGFDPAKQMFMTMAIGGSYFSLVIAIMGLLMAAIGQHLRATTNAANYLGEILALMKSSKV